MDSLDKFVDDVNLDVHIVFDEFHEITEVHDSIGIEGVLRQYIQKIQCFFFIAFALLIRVCLTESYG